MFNDSIMWSLLIPVIIIQLLLMIIALVDWFKNENTNGPRWVWLLIIVFINFIGPILYFIVGRKES